VKRYIYAYTKASLDALAAMPKDVRRQIKRKIDGLAEGSTRQGIKLRGVLDGTHHVYRIRSGHYRILYSIRDDSKIIVLDIGHRRDIYRRLN